MARIETVKGPIAPDELGVCLSHEHVLVNLAPWMETPSEASKVRILDAPLTMDILGEIRRNPLGNKENLFLGDENLAAAELIEYKKWGGRTVVDVTLPGIGRDPLGLRRISEQTGLNLVTSTGWYVQPSHPASIGRKSTEELAQIMVDELTVGIGDTGIKAGVIGEIGCSIPFHPEEQKVLRAASKAQAQTGAGMNIHPGIADTEKKVMGKDAMTQIDLVEKEGGNLSKVYLGHVDYTSLDLDYQRKLMERGIFISYDTWGIEHWVDSYWPGCGPPSDRQRVEAAVELCREGYDKQLIFSHDLCMRYLLTKYGGYGYAHILKNIAPVLKFRGVSEKQLRNILVDNPKKVLSF
jgi:phosphotriesterase-related protein